MKKQILFITLIISLFTFICCNTFSIKHNEDNDSVKIININGKTLSERFNPPSGYTRIKVEDNSFGAYLRKLPLKKSGSKVLYYDGSVKDEDDYEAVIDMPISKDNLQQCADACMRLRAEYLFQAKQYNKISFTLTNGFEMKYSEWNQGKRLKINGNKTWWEKTAKASNTYTDFRAYLEKVFMFAGTLSLSKELKTKKIKDMQIGDIFILGGSPGHAVMVVDMIENKEGKKMFMVAQSYMPAQESQILKNFNNKDTSPWYPLDFEGDLETPQWTFTQNQLKEW